MKNLVLTCLCLLVFLGCKIGSHHERTNPNPRDVQPYFPAIIAPNQQTTVRRNVPSQPQVNTITFANKRVKDLLYRCLSVRVSSYYFVNGVIIPIENESAQPLDILNPNAWKNIQDRADLNEDKHISPFEAQHLYNIVRGKLQREIAQRESERPSSYPYTPLPSSNNSEGQTTFTQENSSSIPEPTPETFPETEDERMKLFAEMYQQYLQSPLKRPFTQSNQNK